MANLTSSLLVRLIDGVSGPAGAAAGALSRLIGVSNTRSAGGGFPALNRDVAVLTNRMQALQSNAMTAAATVGAPATLAAVSGYNTLVQFSKELNKAVAIGELTADQAARVERTSRDIGRDTQFTAMQALQMIRTLVAAGRTVEQAQGMTRPILNTALFGDTDPATAARAVNSIAAAYRLQMNNVQEAQAVATRIGDVMAKASNISQADFTDMVAGFKYAAPFASALNWDIEQLGAAIATLGNQGLRGDEAGVALRSMLVRLIKPTRDATQAMAELGLRFSDFFTNRRAFEMRNFASGMAAAGHRLTAAQQATIQRAVTANAAKPEDQQAEIGQLLTDQMISTLGIGTSRVQDRQKIARAVQLFANSLAGATDPDAFWKAMTDANATPAQIARILNAQHGARNMGMMGPEYQRNLDTIRQSSAGSSARGAAQMEQGLYGAHQRIQSAWENIILTLGKEGGFATNAATTLSAVAESLNKIAGNNPEALTKVATALLGFAALAPVALVISGVAASFGMLTSALGGLVAVLAVIHSKMAAMGLVAAAASTGGAAAGGAAILGAAVVGGVAAYAAGRAIDEVNAIGQGKYYTPTNPADIVDMQAKVAALQAQLAGINERTHPSMRGQPNAQASNIEGEIAQLQNRIALGLRANAGDMQEAGQQLGIKVPEGVRSAAGDAREAGASIGRAVAEGARSAAPGAGTTTPAGARAGGGRVGSGRSYTVGERGVELFTPGANGSITPNAGRGGGSGGGGARPISMAFTMPITISGATDPQATIKQIKDTLADEIRSAMRGIQSDVGHTVST